MGTKTSKRTLVTALSVLVVLLVVIGAIALFRLNAEQDPYVAQESSKSEDTSQDETPSDSSSGDDSAENTSQPDSQPTIDPSAVSTVDIVPMSITVSYVKGIGGFQYEVLRAANGTRYVEFRSASLVGKKCTNDMGTFASIIANPTDSESTGLAKTTTVEDVKYGLALADRTCTTDIAKLEAYQKSFSDAFELLKKLQ